MRALVAGIGGLVVGALAAGGWMWRTNQALEERVARAEAQVATAAQAAEEEERAVTEAPERKARGGPEGTRLLGAIGRALKSGGDEPSPAADDGQQRRERRQQRLKETFGRREGETDEAYRERVTPLVGTMLMVPRGRLAERRREFEEAAGVTDEQREKLDAVFKDTQAELLSVTNQAISSGQLTPYRRNTAGVVGFVGGAATIVESADQRLRSLLSKEQLAVMEQSGFDAIEYLAVTTPWETLTPPPPEPK